MSFERAKSLASAWISHGQGVAAVAQDQWDRMSALAKEAGLSPTPMPRQVMLDEAHDAGRSLNNMVIAAKYDAFVLDTLGRRLERATRDVGRYRPHFSPEAWKSYVDRRSFTEGVMGKVDKDIREGSGGVTIGDLQREIPKAYAEEAKKAWKDIKPMAEKAAEALRKQAECTLRMAADPLDGLACRLGVSKAVVIGGLVVGSGVLLATVVLPTIRTYTGMGR
jgi:hypothetical protein